MIAVKIQKKGRAACLLKITHPTQSNIHINLKDIFKKPLQCLDFCISQLEFNIYNKTYYMHRKDLKFTKNYLIAQSNINLHLKDIIKKPLQCLDFCIRLLELNIYNKTNYMHRKNIKFWKNSLITPAIENEVFSPLIMG